MPSIFANLILKIRYINRYLSPISLISITALLGAGCSGDPVTGPEPVAPTDLLWSIALNHRAVVLSTSAPNNTLQIVATPYNFVGTPLEKNVNVQFAVNDPSIHISTTGLLTALTPGTDFLVRVSVTVDGVTLRDSVFVTVTDITGFSELDTLILSLPTYNAPVAIGTSGNCGNLYNLTAPSLAVRLFDTEMRDITDVPIAFSSSDPRRVAIDPYTGTFQVLSCESETIQLYAETTIYGVRKRDSVALTLTPPLMAQVLTGTINPNSSSLFLGPTTVLIGTGGIVVWVQSSDIPFDIVFDDPDAASAMSDTLNLGYVKIPSRPETGNIDAWVKGTGHIIYTLDPETYRIRQFHTAGTYRYHSTLHNISGTIVVRDTGLNSVAE
jgi:plastocyanin